MHLVGRSIGKFAVVRSEAFEKGLFFASATQGFPPHKRPFVDLPHISSMAPIGTAAKNAAASATTEPSLTAFAKRLPKVKNSGDSAADAKADIDDYAAQQLITFIQSHPEAALETLGGCSDSSPPGSAKPRPSKIPSRSSARRSAPPSESSLTDGCRVSCRL